MKTILSALLFLVLSTGIAQAGVKTEEIHYESGGTPLTGFLAYDDSSGKRPGILVVHEWWGHNQHARNRAVKLAEAGYTALALDMYGDGKLADHPKKAGEFMTAAFKDWEGSKAKFEAAQKILQSHKTVDPDRIGAIGFCFGGAVSIRMARGGADLKGVVGFHSALPLEPAMEKDQVKTSVLVINGSDDGFIQPETVGSIASQMVAANADFTYVTMAGIRHSYTNPEADAFSKKFNLPNLAYNKDADERAWKTMLNFFKRLFAK